MQDVNYDEVVKKVIEFIEKIIEDANAAGVVVGLSGGVDSSLAATLCVRALGKEKVIGILMPTAFTPLPDVKDAQELAEWLEIRTEFVNIQEISEAFFKALRCDEENLEQKIPMANIHARVRMIILYYYANLNNYLVVGTGNRSEALIGYFTKHGDGGADFLPIRHLYKTQVRDLARHLGIPQKIAYKPSSPQLYPGHKISDELPIGYEKLDPVLVGLFDYELPLREVSRLTKVPLRVVEDVLKRCNNSKHKRVYPPKVEE